MRTLVGERQRIILEQLKRYGSVQVARLAAECGVSEVTIRRDLAQMEQEGLLVRFHGGAVQPEALVPDISFGEKAQTRLEEKRRIAQAAAALVPSGATVAMGAGTTVAAICRVLSDRHGLTVVTNAINIGWEAAHWQETRLIMTGGVLRESSYALTGRAAEQTMRDLYVDVAFVGVNGASPVHGFTTPHPEEAIIHQLLLNRARRAVVVTDSSKWGRVALSLIAHVNQVHTLISDSAAPAELVEEFRRAGVEVILA